MRPYVDPPVVDIDYNESLSVKVGDVRPQFVLHDLDCVGLISRVIGTAFIMRLVAHALDTITLQYFLHIAVATEILR